MSGFGRSDLPSPTKTHIMQEMTFTPDNGQCHYMGHELYSSPSPESDQKPSVDSSYIYGERPRSTLPIDAPTQHRRYLTPSATSRKDIPAHVYKQLNRCPAFSGPLARCSEDEHDQLTEEGNAALDPDLLNQIKEKRRRNTLSARKSRQKRIKQMQDLEQERNELLKLVHDYRNYILQVQELLKSNGIMYELPPFCTQ